MQTPKKIESDFLEKIKSNGVNLQRKNEELLANIKKDLPELEILLEKMNGDWFSEDHYYRIMHHSFKCYYAQDSTIEIINRIKKLAPEGCTLNPDFEEIIKKGTEVKFEMSHNRDWLKHTVPIITAFSFAKMLLEMIIKYGKEFKEAPQCLPNGWAYVLYYFNLR